MADKDDQVVVVGSIGDCPIPGSKQFPCTMCARPTWLAPGGQKVAHGGAKVLCLDCARVIWKQHENVAFDVTPEFRQELNGWLKRN
jgi:hypothetical protein